MNNFYDSTYWCILQVTSVTIAGLLLTAWARKSPTIASSITSATTVIVVLLTAIAPFPVHRWLAENVSPTEAQTSGPVNHREYNKLTPANDAVPFAQPMFSLQADNFFAAVKTLANQAEQPRRTNAGLLKITGWFCGFALFIGVVRFLYCLHAVRMTRRLGAVIESRDMTVEVRELADRLGSAAAPAVRESFDVSTAAVVGILSPIVILPGEWRDWSKEERRAVLAHELAHVVRQDSFWRIASCWMGAVHFFNPLIHLLLNRVTLYQELAADEMASEAVGRRCYLRSLSTLALRHDNSSSGQRCPQVMPVFTGHLIRRIKMLRSKDGRANTT